jgi:hypothetical protein
MRRSAVPLLWIAGIAGTLWLLFPFGFPNYDTLYALLWGAELADGTGPDYGVLEPPTPHPLADLWGALVSPLGTQGASDATMVLAYLALAAVAYLVYRLGALWFDRPVGVLAALAVLTRPPILTNGLLGYVDLPYIALVLAALTIESRRPRAGWPILALLAAAGLLRPEAWIFSAAYLAHMTFERDPDRGRLAIRARRDLGRRELAGLMALAASGPVLWFGFDLLAAGEPLYSFTATRDRVGALERQTGAADFLRYGPHRLADVMQPAALIAAATGLVLGFLLLRERARTGIIAALLAGAAFAFLACAGLAVIARYTMLTSAILCVFAALALLGWRLLDRDDPWRRRWQLLAVALVALFVLQASQLREYLATETDDVEIQKTVQDDLYELAEGRRFDPGCGPIAVSSDRAIPRLASRLDLPPSAIVLTPPEPQPGSGYFLRPASAGARLHYGTAPAPPGFREVASNDSWRLYERCG